MARFLLILSYDTKDENQAQRVARQIAEEWWFALRLEGVYQEQPIGEPK